MHLANAWNNRVSRLLCSSRRSGRTTTVSRVGVFALHLNAVFIRDAGARSRVFAGLSRSSSSTARSLPSRENLSRHEEGTKERSPGWFAGSPGCRRAWDWDAKGFAEGTRVKEAGDANLAGLRRGCILRFTLDYLRRSIGKGMNFSFDSAAQRKRRRTPRLRYSA